MPRIRTVYANSVLYLYPSTHAAQTGEGSGGSGFFVGVPSAAGGHFPYAVTNRHVIEGGVLALRLNTAAGQTTVHQTQAADWTFHPDGDDLAVAQLTPGSGHNYLMIPTPEFATQDMVTTEAIGVGDDVFMFGRLVNHEGRQQNTPAVRFGHISLLPHEPIPIGPGVLQECFLADCQSIGGFSGSPVFLATGKLLGVNMGFMTTPLSLLDAATRQQSNELLVSHTGRSLVPQTNSGLMIVIPAWRLQALLNTPALANARV